MITMVRMALGSVVRLGMVSLYIPCLIGNTETFKDKYDQTSQNKK
jgi:hypothetical protein